MTSKENEKIGYREVAAWAANNLESEDAIDLDEVAGWSADKLDSMDHPFLAQKTLISGAILNLFIFGLGAIYHRFVTGMFIETKVGLSILLFGIGFFLSFAVIKLVKNFYRKKKVDRNGIDFMSGYAYISEKNSQFKFWIISTFFGLLNVVLFFVVTQLFADKTIKSTF